MKCLAPLDGTGWLCLRHRVSCAPRWNMTERVVAAAKIAAMRSHSLVTNQNPLRLLRSNAERSACRSDRAEKQVKWAQKLGLALDYNGDHWIERKFGGKDTRGNAFASPSWQLSFQNIGDALAAGLTGNIVAMRAKLNRQIGERLEFSDTVQALRAANCTGTVIRNIVYECDGLAYGLDPL